MAASRPFGTLYTIEWSGYDDRRPADWPRVLALIIGSAVWPLGLIIMVIYCGFLGLALISRKE